MRSGIAPGALVREAQYAQSSPDFISKMSIALKEANEAEFWLYLPEDSGYLKKEISASLK